MNIFSRRMVRFIVIVVSIVIVINLSRSIWDLWRRRDVLGERQEVLRRVEEENKRLQSELEYAQSPEFVEQEARNRLGLGREGEEIVLIRPITKSDQSDQSKSTDKQEENLPNWKKWWRLFF